MKRRNLDFADHLAKLSSQHERSRVFGGFVRLAACALSAGAREEEYLAEAARWTTDELNVFASALGALVLHMEDEPYTDLLGPYYMSTVLSKQGAQWSGEFHTPQSLGRLVAALTVADYPETGPIRVSEPACGSGAMILSLVEALPAEARCRMVVDATDTNRTACDMAFINFTLWHIAARVTHGNSLTGAVWGCWETLPYRCRSVPHVLSGEEPLAATG